MKFLQLYNKIIMQAKEYTGISRGYLSSAQLNKYPEYIRQMYKDFSILRSNYYSMKQRKLREIGFQNNAQQQSNMLFTQILNLIAKSYKKRSVQTGKFQQTTDIQQQKQLKEQLLASYNNKAFTIQDWKKVAEVLKQVKNDKQLKELYNQLLVAYNKLPASMKKLIDMPDKSNVTVVDEIIYHKTNYNNYSQDNLMPEKEIVNNYITIAQSFPKRQIPEQNVYSLLNRHSGKLFVIKYITGSGKQIVRVGKLHVTSATVNDSEYVVKNPLEASRRLSEYNNITYYDMTAEKPGYRNAKLTNVISVSLGNFDTNEGITYIIKH